MIKLPYSIILFGATVLGGLSVNAQTYWSTNFTEAEGYQVGQTVIGVNGWVASRVDGPDTDAGVFMHNDSPALRIISTGETTKNTRIYNAEMSVPDFAIIQARIAYEWDTETSSTTAATFFPDVESQRAFNLNFHPQDGIFLQTGQGDIAILELADVSYGGYYDFEFAINYVTNTFDVSVSGFLDNGNPFAFQQSNITSLNQRSSLNRINIQNNRGDINHLYVEHVAVIPEPSFAALVAGILGMGTVVWLRRRRAAVSTE